MKLTVEGNVNPYYVQTLCMLFFPGVKFSKTDGPAEELEAIVRTAEEDTQITASVVLRCGNQTAAAKTAEPYQGRHTRQRSIKMAVGKAFFDAGEQLLSYRPVWGILTGVRPAKVANSYFEQGFDMPAVQDILCGEFFVHPKKAALAVEIAMYERQIADAYAAADTCSLYISIPFCPTRCSYCSFVSYTSRKLLALIPDYLNKLCTEINETCRLLRSLGKRVTCVYIGGGTPTTLDEKQLARLLDTVCGNLDPDTLSEFTLEAGRPDTITKEKLHIAAEHRVSRVSINPQTLDDKILEGIGRKHTAEDFYRAYDMAKDSGIPCINTDLIAGLPEETFLGFSKTVDKILMLRPENLTVHTFCVKKAADILREGTDIYSRTGGDTGTSVEYAQLSAKNAGYVPYYIYRQKNTAGNLENVGYARDGMTGLYNVFMMEELHSVFAVGAGAVTKLVSPDRKRIERIFSPKYPYEYIKENVKSTINEGACKRIREFEQENRPT